MCWNRKMASPAEEIDVDGIAVRLTNPDKIYFPKLGPDGTKRRLVEYYRAVAAGPDAGVAEGPPDASSALPRRHRRRGDLSEAHPAAPSRLPGNLPDHLPVGPDRRRAAGDPPGRDRLGGADGHDHVASVAGPLPGRRAPRRVARRPRPATGYRFRRSAHRRRRRTAAAARRTRAGGLSQNLRWSWHPCLSADQNRLGFHPGASRRHRARAGGGAPRPGCGDDVVVEGRAG